MASSWVYIPLFVYLSWQKPIEKPWKKSTFPTFSQRRLRLFGLVPSRRFWKLRRHGMEVAPGRTADLCAIRGLHLSKNGGVDHGKNGGFNQGKLWVPHSTRENAGFNHGKPWKMR